MRPPISRLLVFPLMLLALQATVAQERPDLVLFDEDDGVGAGYYDASFGVSTPPSTLRLGGPGDKMLILTNQPHSGDHSGLLQWRSASGGTWTLFVARPGFQTVDAAGYSNLVLYVNSPVAVSASSLPRIGLESSPPDVRSGVLDLGEFLPGGVDGETNTWQRITIPLSAFPPRAGFALSRIKTVVFGQGAPDEISRTVWLDDMRIVAGEGVVTNTTPPLAVTNVITRAGERSVVLHWDRSADPGVAGYHVYRRTTPSEPLVRVSSALLPLQSYADLIVTNGQLYSYVVRAVNSSQLESIDSPLVSATPRPFADDDEFLEYVQQTAFDYFWYEANPNNGLIRDRSDPSYPCSVAAVGFGLSAIAIAVDRNWITREQGIARTLTTLRTFWEGPQGTNTTGTMGYNGWFYHFLDMETGLRSGTTELSSIDTALFLAGVLDARQFFTSASPEEASIRELAQAIFNRVDWLWMANGANSLTHGWRPESGFLPNRWLGYSEAMILYLLGMGAATNPLPAAHWETWTSQYQWQTNYGHAFIPFPPLFGHQYSHCWIDFRRQSDAFMRGKRSTYFENSRRATLAQRAYCIANPRQFTGYSSNLWGLTACDGPGFAPFFAYIARGAPPPLNDDGTIAPTAAGGSLAFTPEFSVPALRFLYDQYRTNIWTGYGFRDAFNLQANWWGPHVIGIDQGPILLMAENFRSGRVWQRFMRNPEIQRGLHAAGFTGGEFARATVQREPASGDINLFWEAPTAGTFHVEYSPNLLAWLISPARSATNFVGTNAVSRFTWTDPGPPATLSPPASVPARFYRVFQLPSAP